MRRVWIDMDAGFDDMAAVAMVARARDIAIVGMSLVAGNAPLDVVVENTRRMAAFLGWRMPIHAGRDRPLIGAPVTAQTVLGADALGGGGVLPAAGEHAPSIGPDAVAALADALSADPPIILALGPLTNVAAVLAARPALARAIPDLVWMGGSAGPGNHTAAAEFNAAADPEAVALVLASGAPLRMVGLDCCRQVTVTPDDAARITALGGERAAVLGALYGAYAGIAAGRPMALYDPVAAAALIDPGLVEFRPARIDMELAGAHTRGMTVCEFRARKAAPNAEVAAIADAAGIRALFHATLMEAAR